MTDHATVYDAPHDLSNLKLSASRTGAPWHSRLLSIIKIDEQVCHEGLVELIFSIPEDSHAHKGSDSYTTSYIN